VQKIKMRVKSANPNPSEILRPPASGRVRKSKTEINAMQKHILARAGTWDGDLSGAELRRRTRP